MRKGYHLAPQAAAQLLVVHGGFRGGHCDLHALKGHICDGFQQDLVLAVDHDVIVKSGNVGYSHQSVLGAEIPLDFVDVGLSAAGADDARDGLRGIDVCVSVCFWTQAGAAVILQLAHLAEMHDGA